MALLDETPTVGDPGHTEVAHAELARLHNILDGSTKTSNAAQAAAEATAATGLAGKAPLASPAFTGTPTAPTAVAGTNTTQLATTAFVLAVRDALLASAPGVLDTLNELAAALGNDANFSTTITNALAGKQPIDSDLTAIAALVTAPVGRSLLTAADAAAIRAISEAQPADSDLTAIAALTTTAYGRALLELANLAALQAVLGTGTPSATTFLRGDGAWAAPPSGGGGGDMLAANNLSELVSAAAARTNLGMTANGASLVTAANYAAMRTLLGLVIGTDVAAFNDARFTTVTHNTQAASYTAVLADAGRLVEMNVAAANTLTVPPNSTEAFPVGTVIGFRQYGAGQVTVTPGAGVTIRSSGGKLKTAAQYAEGTLTKRATDEWVAAGDLAA